MLLKRLKEYADERLSLPPTLYNEAPVRYVIELDSDGCLLNPKPTDTAEPGNRLTRRGQRRPVPQIQRANTIKPLLLSDNSEYVLGLARETSRPERVARCHKAFLDIVDRCAVDTEEPSVIAVQRFLHDDPASQLDPPEDFDRSATLTFRVDGVFPVDLPGVQAFWAAEYDPSRAQDAHVMQCLVCGEQKPVLGRLQAKIKGVPGGQTSGTSIISANADAFESYGLAASLIAPTCADCGERFTKAANELLAGEYSRVIFPGTAFIFWTRNEVPVSFWDLLGKPEPAHVRDLIRSVRSGKRTPQVDCTAFYGAVLSGSGGRAVVRDWIDTTVGDVKGRLVDWFRKQSIVGISGEEPQPLGLYALAYATVRETRDLASPVPRALLRSALLGYPLPWNLLYQAVRRNRAEQNVARPRAALIKLVILGQHHETMEGSMTQLSPENASPAYLCGRLLCVLEQAQRLAVPGIKATIVDRFYGTASSAPASVFSRLLRGAQPHMAKIQRDRPSAYHAIQRRLEEILAGLKSFPSTLTLEQQGLFALGYYHQRAHDRAQAREAAERRKAGLKPGTSETPENPEENTEKED